MVWVLPSDKLPFDLQIAVGTAHRIFVRFRDRRSERNENWHTSNRKLDELHEHYILGMIADNPGLYLNEITSRIKEATNVVADGSLCADYCTEIAKISFRQLNKGVSKGIWLIFWLTRKRCMSSLIKLAQTTYVVWVCRSRRGPHVTSLASTR